MVSTIFNIGSDSLDFSKSKVRLNGKCIDKYHLAYYMVHLPGCYYKFLHFEVYNSQFTYNEIKQALFNYVNN